MASEGVQRRRGQPDTGHGGVYEQPQETSKQRRPAKAGLSPWDVVRIFGGLILVNFLLSYFVTHNSVMWGWRPWFLRPAFLMHHFHGQIALTDAELMKYDGSNLKLPIYLALDGIIYDVTVGRHLYAPGGSYHVFAGKDATRGFITGCFAEDGTPDTRGAEWTYVPTDVPDFDEKDVTGAQKKYREQELRKARKHAKATVEGWQKMFRGEGGKDYFEVGTVEREEGWLEKLPKRTLCAEAQKARPKPTAADSDADDDYREL